MATLTVQDATVGADLAFSAAAAGGDQVPSGSTAGGWELPVVLVVKNGGAAAITVTVGSFAGVSIAAAGTGLFPVNESPAIGDLASVTYSAVTSVTVAAAKLVPIVI